MQIWLDRFLLLVIVISILAIVVAAIDLCSRASASERNAAIIATALAITR